MSVYEEEKGRCLPTLHRSGTFPLLWTALKGEPKSDVTRQVCSPPPLLPCALCPSDGPPPLSVFRLPGSPQQARRNQPRLFTLASRARLRSALRVFPSATHASFSPSSPELPGTVSASKRKTVSHPKCSNNEMGPPRSASGSHVPIPTPARSSGTNAY